MGGHRSATGERALERDRKFIKTNVLYLKLPEKAEVGQGSLSMQQTTLEEKCYERRVG